MNLRDFQIIAGRTAQFKDEQPDKMGIQPERLNYAMLKLAEEVGEVIGPATKARYHGSMLLLVKIEEELGDAMWSIAEIASSLGLSLEDVGKGLERKLLERHGESYNEKGHYSGLPKARN